MPDAALARPAHRRSEVGPIELFFDLVYVFAIIQLSYLLLGQLTVQGAAQTTVIFAALWWGWNYTAWAMNWLNPARTAVQLLTGALMLGALGMAIAIPDAFGTGAWLFVGSYLFMGIVRPVFMIIAHRVHQLSANYRMLLLWTLVAGVFWVLGAALPSDLRLWLWLVAVLIDYAGPLVQFRIPGVGSAPMQSWKTDPEHLAERNRLVFIIALGESILLMGGSVVARDQLTPTLALGLVIGLASLFALWWNYFALAGHDIHGGSASTGALRTAYAYAHALMVYGAILVAVAIQLSLTQGHLTREAVVVTAAGPLVYLAGNVMFLRSRFGEVGRSRYIAAGAVAVIAIIAFTLVDQVPILAMNVAVLAVGGSLAAHTARQRRGQPAQLFALTRMQPMS